MSRILELYGNPTVVEHDWAAIAAEQKCPYSQRRCFKVRKSDPTQTIGSCVVAQGKELRPLVICPNKFLADRGKVFIDSLHLLTLHEPGNEIHLLREQAIPGGSVDFFLVSSREGRAVDFVGIEFQGLDTTGSVWPHRQAFLKAHGVPVEPFIDKTFGVNWKMTAKTILIQLNHKIGTFESLSKKFVLVLQDDLLTYMKSEFSFGGLQSARLGDSMHFHSYKVASEKNVVGIQMVERVSTNAAGIAQAMNLGKSGNLVLEEVLEKITSRLSASTLFSIV